MRVQEEAQRTSADCGHFSMPVPDFSELDVVATDIAETKVRLLPTAKGPHKLHCHFVN